MANAPSDRCTATLTIKGASFQATRAACEAWVAAATGQAVWMQQGDGSLVFAGIVVTGGIVTVRPAGTSPEGNGHGH